MAKRQAGDRFTILSIDKSTFLVKQFQIGYWWMEWAYFSQAQKIADEYQSDEKNYFLKVVKRCCVEPNTYWDPITEKFYKKIDSLAN